MGIKGNRNTQPEKITANNIINGFCSNILRTRRNNKVYPNTYISSWECDVLEITKAGYSHEYEVKISRSDFKADFSKQKRGKSKYDILQTGERVNYFSYICPPELISPDEVPTWAGLIYAQPYTAYLFNRKTYDTTEAVRIEFKIIKPPIKLSTNKINNVILQKINECIYYRFHELRTKLSTK